MKLIENLSDMIEDELDDARKYIKCAEKWKEERPAMANVFYQISTEEMRHMNLLHDQVVNIISEYRKNHGDPPEKMQGIYEYLHKKQMEKANEIRVLQELYKD